MYGSSYRRCCPYKLFVDIVGFEYVFTVFFTTFHIFHGSGVVLHAIVYQQFLHISCALQTRYGGSDRSKYYVHSDVYALQILNILSV